MRTIILVCFILFLCRCQKQEISISGNASDIFYVENGGEAMRVYVHGNTAGKIYILVIHGGPGVSSYFYDTKYINQNLGGKYAMVYWDQRNAGGSQGTGNGKYLNLSQMVDDLVKVIDVLKERYGSDMKLYLLGHSFGGLLAADFLTSGVNQEMVKGYIDVDGSHNYQLNDTLTREMLLNYGTSQIVQNHNAGKWKPILDYCKNHKGPFDLEESQQLEQYAGDAEKLADSVTQVKIVPLLLKYSISDEYPLTAILSNLLYSEDSDFNKELALTQFSSVLNKITIPVLVLWGKYDFTCPPALGQDFYNYIGSQDKRMIISPVSGHNMIFQDEKFFCDEVDTFVQHLN